MRGRAAPTAKVDSAIRRRLADAVIDRYCEWREECEQVWTSDPGWSGDLRANSAMLFAAHHAAIDREECAADRYAEALEVLREQIWLREVQ
jgi:hypothetical protein